MEPFSLADARDLQLSPADSTFRWSGHPVRLQMGGRFNVANALAAATTARAVGIDAAVVAEALSAAPVVPGHFEPIEAGQPFAVIVDYAHTPEALDAVLASARQAAGDGGRLIAVFGCGGDRDPGKRPQMGAAVSAGADIAVLTSDNPRSEDPDAILDDVQAGMDGPARVVRQVDREAAIALALDEARPGDVVVVAGKGHETGQEIGGQVLPFDDREVVRRLLGGAS
jgi:UDP-N-acetylmuramoyl-L-alanyl-D-glutamate--2,6-diaminopimelate ligase